MRSLCVLIIQPGKENLKFVLDRKCPNENDLIKLNDFMAQKTLAKWYIIMALYTEQKRRGDIKC